MAIVKTTEGHGENVVILHGWGGDLRHMEPIARLLIPRYRVTNINLPGTGQSSWREETRSIHDIADQLLADLPEKAIYIGWSFGGLVAMSLAARYPQRVVRFIGIGTTPKFIPDRNWPGDPGFKIISTKIKEKGFKSFWMGFLDAEFADFILKPQAYLDLSHMPAQFKSLDIFIRGIDICDATDLRKEFASLTCPIDLILGEQDGMVPKEAFKKISHLNSHARLHIIHGAHHMPFWTHPDAFNRILQSILHAA